MKIELVNTKEENEKFCRKLIKDVAVSLQATGMYVSVKARPSYSREYYGVDEIDRLNVVESGVDIKLKDRNGLEETLYFRFSVMLHNLPSEF